ncbi:hypothetical protein KUTeg_010864 [Tegillarca granosa]|uniref:Uncharacterized protein n=1 Tax=Tegillarca granosa TaxID=220873 RepID=A0ABQ9F282_TEGGR|nr:hypothetical protein KUTeg_010864 [Tegillarca granosa]
MEYKIPVIVGKTKKRKRVISGKSYTTSTLSKSVSRSLSSISPDSNTETIDPVDAVDTGNQTEHTGYINMENINIKANAKSSSKITKYYRVLNKLRAHDEFHIELYVENKFKFLFGISTLKMEITILGIAVTVSSLEEVRSDLSELLTVPSVVSSTRNIVAYCFTDEKGTIRDASMTTAIMEEGGAF